VVAALGAPAFAGPLTFGAVGANRVVSGRGTFPRLVVLSAAGDVPFRWVVSLPPKRLAAIDAAGTLWIFKITPAELQVLGRYGEVASAEGPPAVAASARGSGPCSPCRPRGAFSCGARACYAPSTWEARYPV
jgi:hypothetical protein